MLCLRVVHRRPWRASGKFLMLRYYARITPRAQPSSRGVAQRKRPPGETVPGGRCPGFPGVTASILPRQPDVAHRIRHRPKPVRSALQAGEQRIGVDLGALWQPSASRRSTMGLTRGDWRRAIFSVCDLSLRKSLICSTVLAPAYSSDQGADEDARAGQGVASCAGSTRHCTGGRSARPRPAPCRRCQRPCRLHLQTGDFITQLCSAPWAANFCRHVVRDREQAGFTIAEVQAHLHLALGVDEGFQQLALPGSPPRGHQSWSRFRLAGRSFRSTFQFSRVLAGN